MAIQAHEVLKARERISHVIERETGKLVAQVRQDIERDLWMPAEEAVAYDLASRIIQRREELIAA